MNRLVLLNTSTGEQSLKFHVLKMALSQSQSLLCHTPRQTVFLLMLHSLSGWKRIIIVTKTMKAEQLLDLHLAGVACSAWPAQRLMALLLHVTRSCDTEESLQVSLRVILTTKPAS